MQVYKCRNILLAVSLIIFSLGQAFAQGQLSQESGTSTTANLTTTSATSSTTIQTTNTPSMAFPVKNVHWVRVQPPLPDDVKTAGVYFEFKNSPEFTTRFKKQLQIAGYKVAETVGDAKYPFIVTGSFNSQGKTETVIDLGKVLQEGLASTKPVDKERLTASHLGSLGFDAAMTQKLLSAGMIDKFVGAGFMLNSLADATGFRSWFNQKVAGDRRGVCLGSCTHWHWSSQRTVLKFDEPKSMEVDKFPITIGVGVFSSGFWPSEITELALLEMHRYFGLIDAPPPPANFPAVMSRDQIIAVNKSQRNVTEP